jgi:hypothetical protein
LSDIHALAADFTRHECLVFHHAFLRRELHSELPIAIDSLKGSVRTRPQQLD